MAGRSLEPGAADSAGGPEHDRRSAPARLSDLRAVTASAVRQNVLRHLDDLAAQGGRKPNRSRRATACTSSSSVTRRVLKVTCQARQTLRLRRPDIAYTEERYLQHKRGFNAYPLRPVVAEAAGVEVSVVCCAPVAGCACAIVVGVAGQYVSGSPPRRLRLGRCSVDGDRPSETRHPEERQRKEEGDSRCRDQPRGTPPTLDGDHLRRKGSEEHEADHGVQDHPSRADVESECRDAVKPDRYSQKYRKPTAAPMCEPKPSGNAMRDANATVNAQAGEQLEAGEDCSGPREPDLHVPGDAEPERYRRTAGGGMSPCVEAQPERHDRS
jgi:hypothetical protein